MIQFEVNGRKGEMSERHGHDLAAFLHKRCDGSWGPKDVLPARHVSAEETAAAEAANKRAAAQREAGEQAAAQAEAARIKADLEAKLAEVAVIADDDGSAQADALKEAEKEEKKANKALAEAKAKAILDQV